MITRKKLQKDKQVMPVHFRYDLKVGMKTLHLVLLILGQWSYLSNGSCSSEAKCLCEPYLSGWNVDCSGLDLSISPTFYGIVYSINLSRNSLNKVPSKDRFNNTKYLNHFDLSRNGIVNIHSEETKQLFMSLENLKSLNISHNVIPIDNDHVTNYTFSDLHLLESLDISFNNLTNHSLNLDHVFEKLVHIRHLSIDAVNNMSFGPVFSTFKNLTSLKVQGRCFKDRLLTLDENFFQHLRFIENLDLSAEADDPKSINPCSLQFIERKAISGLKYLTDVDLSFNRQLGLCGLRNVTVDLSLTRIKSLNARFIQCEHGISTTLFCDDLKGLTNTSLEYLNLDGNNIGSAQTGVLHYLPVSLKWLTLRDNRFVRSRYAYCNLQHLVNLKYVDISNINSLEESKIHTRSLFCEPFNREIYCQSQRGKYVGVNDVVTLADSCQRTCVSKRVTPLHCVVPIPNQNVSFSSIFIPPNLETLILDNSQLGHNFIWSHFSYNSLKTLVLSNNQLYSITGPICHVSQLRHLDISNNHCSMLSSYAFSDMVSLRTLNLSKNLIGFWLAQNNSVNLFTAQTSLRTLCLSSNRITSLPVNIFQDLVELRYLYLANNAISDWTAFIPNLTKLIYIDLSFNQIMYFSAKGISLLSENKSPNLTINLENNLLQCTCESLHSLKWMLQNRKLFTKFSSYKCNDGENDYLENAVMKLKTDCASQITLIVITFGCLVVFLSIIVPGLLYRNRWRIRYWYYIVKRRYGKGYQPQVNDTDYSFDTYLSYAEDDVNIIRDVIKNLEEPHGYKICIRHRDFIPGCDIADNIINAIHQSRKVIFIITRQFLQSSWCLFEVRMALTEYIESRRGNNIMIIVFRENVSQKELPDYLSRVIQEEVSIEFPQDPEHEETFWTSLKESLS